MIHGNHYEILYIKDGLYTLLMAYVNHYEFFHIKEPSQGTSHGQGKKIMPYGVNDA